MKLSTLRHRAKTKRAVVRTGSDGTLFLVDSVTFLTIAECDGLAELETAIAWCDDPNRVDFAAMGAQR